jgi:hypothetical protein
MLQFSKKMPGTVAALPPRRLEEGRTEGLFFEKKAAKTFDCSGCGLCG